MSTKPTLTPEELTAIRTVIQCKMEQYDLYPPTYTVADFMKCLQQSLPLSQTIIIGGKNVIRYKMTRHYDIYYDIHKKEFSLEKTGYH
jgi:hypothetical protein